MLPYDNVAGLVGYIILVELLEMSRCSAKLNLFVGLVDYVTGLVERVTRLVDLDTGLMDRVTGLVTKLICCRVGAPWCK